VRPEGLGKFKKITSSGIEPTTFRFVAQSALTTTLPRAVSQSYGPPRPVGLWPYFIFIAVTTTRFLAKSLAAKSHRTAELLSSNLVDSYTTCKYQCYNIKCGDGTAQWVERLFAGRTAEGFEFGYR
jgi:hypothetical protein